MGNKFSSHENLNPHFSFSAMFSQSGTNTPVPQSRNVPVPIHDTIGESITWINDWFSFDQDGQGANSLQLKGWVKTNQSHKTTSHKSFINLNDQKWQYLKEVKEEQSI